MWVRPAPRSGPARSQSRFRTFWRTWLTSRRVIEHTQGRLLGFLHDGFARQDGFQVLVPLLAAEAEQFPDQLVGVVTLRIPVRCWWCSRSPARASKTHHGTPLAAPWEWQMRPWRPALAEDPGEDHPMATSLNRFNLLGYLGDDMKIKEFRDGTSLGEVAVATDYGVMSVSDEWTERTEGLDRC
ncbi:MAG: hypothetical protein OXC19_05310 [Bryobacterales bacterium]|nr:hypothetical protein [Bryobacterales bacterium]